MVKKFSYLVSVSVLASSLLSSASHAVYDDELRDVINSFRAPQSQVTPPSSSSSSDEPSSWLSSACAVGSSVLSGTGHMLRYLGDSVRGEESLVGEFLVDNALSLAASKGTSATKFVEATKSDKKTLKSLQKTGGNALRYVGALMSGETPTLERTIREFWIDKRVSDNPEEAFISTACALYRSQQVSGVDEIKLNYRKFTDAWNSSSYTVPSHNAGQNVEYFLKGIIRGFVMNEQAMDSFEVIETHMAALGITYENFPLTKAITAKTVITKEDERELLTPAVLQQQVDKARQLAFMGFVESTYRIETLKKQADQARLTSLQVPSALPAPHSLLAIGYEPHHDNSSSAAGDGIKTEQVD
ncbi:MAG: hypothetical protein K2Y08_03670 [Alphaproteobacteria bacterium]|nr:hypothetical protein [Alphaproteobacteria bacterium]